MLVGYVSNMKLKHALVFVIVGYILFIFAQVFYKSSPSRVLVWWTPFVNIERLITCQNNCKCLVTDDRSTKLHEIEAYIFYGSNIDVEDLPIPKHIPWALFHEESPKNLPMLLNKKVQDTFDIISTFSRFSDLPITLQYLKELNLLTSNEYYVPVGKKNEYLKDLAPVLYLQTDCDTPIERDEYVKDLMKYIKVDSYGACLNNKELPESENNTADHENIVHVDLKKILDIISTPKLLFKMTEGFNSLKLNQTYELYSEELMRFVARYKFVIAIENAKCYDYITEKLWRPLIVGSIPIYMGSPTIKDWLPNNKSAILIEQFLSMESLANYIKLINGDDDLYRAHLEHKTKGLVSNDLLLEYITRGHFGVDSNEENVITAFECFVCEKMHEGKYTKFSRNSYDCDRPKSYKDEPNSWLSFWTWGENNAKEFLDKVHTIK